MSLKYYMKLGKQEKCILIIKMHLEFYHFINYMSYDCENSAEGVNYLF